MVVEVFVINLKRRTDRLERMEAHLSSIGLKFERIDAFDARDCPLNGKVHWLRAYVYNFLSRPPIGHVGVFTSHRHVWQLMVERKIDQALVLEDDVVPVDWDPAILDADISSIGLDMLRLEQIEVLEFVHLNPLPPESYSGRKLLGRRISTENSFGLAAYIMTRSGAEKCLGCKRFWFFVDHFRMWALFYDLKTAVLEPVMWKQDRSDISDISVDGERQKLFFALRKIPRKIMLGIMLVARRVF